MWNFLNSSYNFSYLFVFVSFLCLPQNPMCFKFRLSEFIFYPLYFTPSNNLFLIRCANKSWIVHHYWFNLYNQFSTWVLYRLCIRQLWRLIINSFSSTFHKSVFTQNAIIVKSVFYNRISKQLCRNWIQRKV